MWLQAPDDGLGALPLLRHVIVNDSKSSTYKLALLRVVIRIAASATGLVEGVDDDTVAVPLGLFALSWIRTFKPLIEQNILRSRRTAGTPGWDSSRLAFDRSGGCPRTPSGSARGSPDLRRRRFSPR
jgi:hypothetical protein